MDDARTNGTFSTCVLSRKFLHIDKAVQIIRASPMKPEDFLKFSFVRNPWDRIFGGYRSKFILAQQVDTRACPEKGKLAPFAQHVVDSVQQRRSEAKVDGISFRDFVEYSAITNDHQLDIHWCSQSYLLAGYQPDVVGHFERLAEDFAPILHHSRKQGYSVTAPPLTPKPHPSTCSSGTPGQYADICHLSLTGLDVTQIHPIDFYTPEIVELVNKRFEYDIRRFGFSYKC